VFWLCACETREDGSGDDAYAYFARLHRAGQLCPAKADYTRIKAELFARVITASRNNAANLIRDAHARSGRDLPFMLADEVQGRLHASSDDELWIAISRQPATAPDWLNDRLVMLIFAAFDEAVSATESEQRADWPTGDLAYHEVAKFFL